MHQAARAGRPRHRRAQRRQGPRHPVPARPDTGGLQHRRHDPLAGLQRHLAGCGVGSPFGQPGRDPRHRGLPGAAGDPHGRHATDRARRTHRDDQGARDPGCDRAGKCLQPSRPRPCAAGAHRFHGGRHRDARWHGRAGDQRALERLPRWRRAACVSTCAAGGPAQELGCGGRHESCPAPCLDGPGRRNGLSRCADGQDLGFQRRRAEGRCDQGRSRARQLRDGKHPVQDFFPGGIPRADGR